jgi:predicted nucleic acid-binding protein
MTRPHHAIAVVRNGDGPLDNGRRWRIATRIPSAASGTPATIPASVVAAAEKIANDPQVLALVKEQSTDAAAKARWNQFLELVRIPSPPRQEHLKAAEIHRRLVNEWGFSPDEVMTRADGVIAASDTNLVDGLPVYNACVVIKGSYSSRADAQQYHGQFPKVLVEGHIDVVNPEDLPMAGDPSIRIKLQPYAHLVVATPEEPAAIPDELSFDARGRVVEDDKYATASRVFKDAKDAEAGGGVRIYVPGYGDMMRSTSNAFVLASAMKKHTITPVYDIWICGTAGEEGKGNLAGVKQLYGFDQKAGTGSNPLNIVANFGLEGGGVVNFAGSYRFEMKFKAPFARERSQRPGGHGRGDREDRRPQDADGPERRERAENHLHRRPRQLRAADGSGPGCAELLARSGHALDAQGDARGHPTCHRADVPGRGVHRKREAWPQGRER